MPVIVQDAQKDSATPCAWQRQIRLHGCLIHATEIHLCSLIGVCTYMHEYMNISELDIDQCLRSLNRAYTKCLWKIVYMRLLHKEVYDVQSSPWKLRIVLQWLERWWLVYHGYFELVLESPGKNRMAADLGRVIFFLILKMVYCVYSLELPRWGDFNENTQHTFMFKKIEMISLLCLQTWLYD